ncbi:MAG: hypothetical protein E7618_05575 [Ruminococcaceae bacterium]|nr:hypothetical protein [Oscillospiraceae bacterium]
MKHSGLQITTHKNGRITLSDSDNNLLTDILVCESRCIINIYDDAKSHTKETVLDCRTEEEARNCGEAFARFILNGDPDKLNWYIGMDFEDVFSFFSAPKLQFLDYEENLTAVHAIADRINARFPDDSDLLIVIESASLETSILVCDRLKFSRWKQVSLDQAQTATVRVCVWYHPTAIDS